MKWKIIILISIFSIISMFMLIVCSSEDFKYLDEVEIVGGFYEGQSGKIIGMNHLSTGYSVELSDISIYEEVVFIQGKNLILKNNSEEY